ncbi:hypothetical protein HK099_004754 [Clydaea vesicula]|uniref:Uncharacterized protein n=1 Tax=Clydaea vesicula TaxID=447962 RepID=A0AAD5XVE7_9FUNG|nr:hypothetical protein HK099_004754 [Clydaea vesicula]
MELLNYCGDVILIQTKNEIYNNFSPIILSSAKVINPIAYIGEQCRGSTLDLPICSQNSECVYNVGNKDIGAAGICKEVFHREGEICGGGTRAAFQCEAGLICITNTVPGQRGVCGHPLEPLLYPKIADVGHRCGGGTLNAHVCGANGRCVYSHKNKERVGASGHCKEVFHGLDEVCGGSDKAAFRCKLGLTCNIPPTAPPGATGVCKHYHI